MRCNHADRIADKLFIKVNDIRIFTLHFNKFRLTRANLDGGVKGKIHFALHHSFVGQLPPVWWVSICVVNREEFVPDVGT